MENDCITNKPFKVWITKYALTSGVTTALARLVDNERMIAVKNKDAISQKAYFHKPHWHRTEAEAVEQVRRMCETKLESLCKHIDKIEQILAEIGP